LGQFVPDLAHAMQPLRGLLKKDFAFQWLDDHDKAFAAVKAILTNPQGPVLAHFDSSLPTTLLTDASRLKGLGFALLQTKPDGSTVLVQCGSRFLSDAETRYAVCELEALAIQWAIHRCRLYLLGIMFKVVTDHKPLTGIFKGSNLDAVDNPRLQRILQKVAGYTFYVEWVPGKTHQIADALSRAPVFDPEEADKSNQDFAVVSAVSITSDPAITKLSAAANLDINYQAIISALKNNVLPKSLPLSHPARLFSKQWDGLSFEESTGFLVFHGHRLVVPYECRSEVLQELHKAHQGLRRTKARAKSLYFWPGIGNDINQVISSCQLCQASLPSQPYEPLIQSNAFRPFQSLSADLFDCAGKTYLVVVDRYSGWPLVSGMRRTDTKTITDTMADWFCDWGIPEVIRTDGGPQFRSEFDGFCKQFNITHELTSPYNPRSNGHAEAAVKAMKSLLTKSTSWSDFRSSLLEWRNIPRTDGLSPAQWLFNRLQRTKSPALSTCYDLLSKESLAESQLRRGKEDGSSSSTKHSLSVLSPSTLVRIQDTKTRKWDKVGTILSIRKNKRSYNVLVNGKQYLRNRRYLRLAEKTREDSESNGNESPSEREKPWRSARNRTKPTRYKSSLEM
jgi:hypothetical protein